jgi:hypothetical protein
MVDLLEDILQCYVMLILNNWSEERKKKQALCVFRDLVSWFWWVVFAPRTPQENPPYRRTDTHP